jgi:hypothetical protein
MKKRICAVLLSLCSLIGVAERRSNASVIGKVLKYGSVSIAGAAHLAALYGSMRMYEYKEDIDILGESIQYIPYVGNYLEFLADNFCYKAIGIVNLLDLWLIDSPCLNLYTLGKYLDKETKKSDSNPEKKSSKRTVSDKNKSSNPKDKNQNLHEDSKKS